MQFLSFLDGNFAALLCNYRRDVIPIPTSSYETLRPAFLLSLYMFFQADEKYAQDLASEESPSLSQDDAASVDTIAYPVSDAESDNEEKAPKKPKIGKHNAKNWLMTYPKNATTKDVALETILNSDQIRKELVYVCVGEEKHKDGTPHLHVFLQYKKKRQFRDYGCLDKIAGKHGNYQGQKFGTVTSMVEYVKKDGVFVEWGKCDLEINHWAAAREAAKEGKLEEANAMLWESKPRDMFLYADRISQNARSLCTVPKPVWKPRFHVLPFNVPSGITNWVEEELPKQERALCLVLIGPTRFGKTSWARSLRATHNYFRGEFSLQDFNSKAELTIYDDCANMSSTKFPYRKQLLTQMGQATLTDKYMKKITIDVCMPTIVLCNEESDVPWCTDSEHKEYKYWSQNVFIVQLTESMF